MQLGRHGWGIHAVSAETKRAAIRDHRSQEYLENAGEPGAAAPGQRAARHDQAKDAPEDKFPARGACIIRHCFTVPIVDRRYPYEGRAITGPHQPGRMRAMANRAREDPLAVAGAAGWPGPGKLRSGNPGGTCMANRPVNTGSGGAAAPPPDAAPPFDSAPPPVHHDATPSAPAAAIPASHRATRPRPSRVPRDRVPRDRVPRDRVRGTAGPAEAGTARRPRPAVWPGCPT